MACPQRENGFTPIANELLEKIISSGLNGTELAIVFHIIRKTYGYSKKEDEISLSQFLLAIPTTKQTIVTALNNLQLVKIVRLVKKGTSKNSSNLWVINKDYDTWQLVKKSRLVKKNKSTSKDFHIQLVKKTRHTKEIYKRNIQKKDIAVTSTANSNLISNTQILPELLKDNQKHIQVIGLYAKAKKVEFTSKEQQSSFILRNVRGAKNLVGYEMRKIVDTMKYLIDNADYKWTLETVGKFIDEDLVSIKNPGVSEYDLIKKALNS